MIQHRHESFNICSNYNSNNSWCLPGPSGENPFYGQEVMCFRFLAATWQQLVFICCKETIFDRGQQATGWTYNMCTHLCHIFILWKLIQRYNFCSAKSLDCSVDGTFLVSAMIDWLSHFFTLPLSRLLQIWKWKEVCKCRTHVLFTNAHLTSFEIVTCAHTSNPFVGDCMEEGVSFSLLHYSTGTVHIHF